MKFSPMPFHAIIKPVGDLCNMNCNYCFYKEKSGSDISKMSPETLEKLTRNYIQEQPIGCKEVQFVWQGGEPTLAGISFFETAVALQTKYARTGMKITNAIQTNGTLLNDKWFELLKRHNFQVGLSIDGNKSVHDIARFMNNGKPSHDKVLSVWEQLKHHGITTNILAVVHNDNVAHAVDSFRFFADNGAKVIQFLPVVNAQSPINTHGTACHTNNHSQHTLDAEKWGDFLTQVFDVWTNHYLGQVTVQLFDATFTRIATGYETFCVHAHECGNQIAIEKDGSVYSCDHFVEDRHYLGDVSQPFSEMIFQSPIQQAFRELSTQHDSACQGCHVKGLCQGGCPKHRDSLGKNQLCAGYKRFFNASMPTFLAMTKTLQLKRGLNNYRMFLPEMEIKLNSIYK